MSTGRVGVAPGTTTLTLGDAPAYRDPRASWTAMAPGPIQQNPGIIVRNVQGLLMGPDHCGVAGLGMIRPTDFEMSSIRDYVPVQSAWIVGTPTISGAEEEGSRRKWLIAAGVMGGALAVGGLIWVARRRR